MAVCKFHGRHVYFHSLVGFGVCLNGNGQRTSKCFMKRIWIDTAKQTQHTMFTECTLDCYTALAWWMCVWQWIDSTNGLTRAVPGSATKHSSIACIGPTQHKTVLCGVDRPYRGQFLWPKPHNLMGYCYDPPRLLPMHWWPLLTWFNFNPRMDKQSHAQ